MPFASHRQNRGSFRRRRVPSSANSSSSSSRATISDESCEDERSVSLNRLPVSPSVHPVGTIVKKYFNGLGWVFGKITNIAQNGMYEVRFDSEGSTCHLRSTYSHSKVSRLMKTASLRIGTKLAIYWPRERRFYTAIITKELPRKRENYLICYCHSAVEREWIDLHRHKFRIVVQSSEHNQCVIRQSDDGKFEDTISAEGKDLSHSHPIPDSNCVGSNQLDDQNCYAMRSGLNVISLTNHNVISMSNLTEENENFEKCCSEEASKATCDFQESNSSFESSRKNVPLHLSLHDSCGFRFAKADDESTITERISETIVSKNTQANRYLVCSGDENHHVTGPEMDSSRKRLESLSIRVLGEQENKGHSIQDADVNSISNGEFDTKSCHDKIQIIFDKSAQSSIESSFISNEGKESLYFQPVSRTIETNVNRHITSELSIDPRKMKESEDNIRGVDENVSSSISEIEGTLSLIDVGSRVEVYWTEDKCYYAGMVTRKRQPKHPNSTKKPFFLQYDDGDSEWIDFRDHCFRLLDVSCVPSDNVIVSNNGNEACTHVSCVSASDIIASDIIDSDIIASSTENEACEHVKCESESHYEELCMKETLSEESNCVEDTMGTDMSNDIIELDCSRTPKKHENVVEEVKVSLKTDSSYVHANQECPESTISGIDNTFSSVKSEVSVDETENVEVRRTQRNLCPTKFFANEIDGKFSLIRNSSDHSRTKFGDNKHETITHHFSADVDNLCLDESSNHTKRLMENRKAALNALVKKKLNKSSGFKSNCLEDEVVSNASVCHKRNFLKEDLFKLQSGTRVSVLRDKSQQYCEGIITERHKESYQFFVKFENDATIECIDFEQSSFMVLKRKRGRPKKVISMHNNDTGEKGKCKADTLMEEEEQTTSWSMVQIGSKVAVLCEDDGEYHNGTVSEHKSNKESFFISYDNSDKVGQWVDLRKHKFKLIDEIEESRKRSRQMINCTQSGDVSKIRVGSHIAVWWEGEAKYIAGVVTKVRNNDRPFYLDYDDGQAAHWVNLKNRKFKFLDRHWDDIDSVTSSPRKKHKQNNTTVNVNAHKLVNLKSSEGKRKGEEGTPNSKDTSISKVKVGSRINVWWAGDCTYYQASVLKKDDISSKFYIQYDDNEKEWIDLKKNWFQLLPSKNVNMVKNSPMAQANSSDTTDSEDESEDRKEEENDATVERSSDQENNFEKNVEGVDSIYGTEGIISGTDAEKDFVYGDVEKVKVGTRIAVWWTLDKVYYAGRVESISNMGRKPYFIKYFDGDEEWTDLRKRYFRLLDK